MCQLFPSFLNTRNSSELPKLCGASRADIEVLVWFISCQNDKRPPDAAAVLRYTQCMWRFSDKTHDVCSVNLLTTVNEFTFDSSQRT